MATGRVLIIDDKSETILQFKLSFTVVEKERIDFASNGKDAVALLAKNKYDKVITDFRLNDDEYDGLMLLQIARKEGVPVRILITAVSSEIDLSATAITNAVRKPCDCDMIREMVFTNKWDASDKKHNIF